jgi:hypothetical protein
MIGRGSRKNARWNMRIYMSMEIILAILFLILSPQVMAQSDEVRVFIAGPDSLPINGSQEYTITIVGGPAEEEHLGENESANWSYVARLENPIPQGATVTPKLDNGTNSVFTVTVEAPVDTRPITLIVNGTSANDTESLWSGNVFKEIDVFRPINVNITAVVRNPTNLDVKGADVSFFVIDDEGITQKLGNKTESVDANSTKEVYWEWITSKKDKGEYVIEVRINDDGSLLEFEDGDNVIQQTIYVGKRPARPQGAIMIFNHDAVLFLIGVIAFFFALGAILMWNNTRRGRGYYSSSSTYSMIFVGFLSLILSMPVFSVSQILVENPDADGDPTIRFAQALVIFILGFITIFFTWDRTRKRKR